MLIYITILIAMILEVRSITNSAEMPCHKSSATVRPEPLSGRMARLRQGCAD